MMFKADAPHLQKQLAETTLPTFNTIVLLISCQKMEDRREACRSTWLAHGIPDGMKVVFLVGRPGKPNELVGDVIYLNCPDTYLGLPQKTYAGIREALTLWDFEWIFKADDDTLINLPRLAAYHKSRDYIGRKAHPLGLFDPDWHIGKSVDPTEQAMLKNAPYRSIQHPGFLLTWANGGPGYFLSRRAAKLVAREPFAHVEREVYEDRFVGHVMASYGIQLHGKHQNLRGITYRTDKLTPKSNIYGATTLHPLNPPQMREVYYHLFREGEFGT